MQLENGALVLELWVNEFSVFFKHIVQQIGEKSLLCETTVAL